MEMKTNEFFLNGKFKKIYAIITFSLIMIINILFIFFYISKNNFLTDSVLYGYVTCFYFLFIALGLILDEKIRKYPGLLVVVGGAVYSSNYMFYNVLRGEFSLLGGLYCTISVLIVIASCFIYTIVYPKIAINKNGCKIFNTVYLMIIVSLTFILGNMYWL